MFNVRNLDNEMMRAIKNQLQRVPRRPTYDGPNKTISTIGMVSQRAPPVISTITLFPGRLRSTFSENSSSSQTNACIAKQAFPQKRATVPSGL